MGKHIPDVKNVAGWVTTCTLSLPPSLKSNDRSKRDTSLNYDRDVIRYAHQDMSFLLPDDIQVKSFQEFADLIEKKFDCVNDEIMAETVKTLRKYPPEIVNKKRDDTKLGRKRNPYLTALIKKIKVD